MLASRLLRTTSVRRVRGLRIQLPILSLTQLTGKPVSHQFAKEALAGFAGAEVDRLAETKGMDEYDREKVKRQAQDNASNMYDQHYGVPLANRFYQNKPPTILDIPLDAQAEGLNIPDPGNPVVGAKGIGEPGIGVGASSVLCALANALGNDDILTRTPVQPQRELLSQI